jgi:transcriptional regulator with XRE-family HTH domain
MSSPKTEVQEAVIALRRALGLTQQQLSEAMKVTVVTVCRWETVRPPSGLSLVRLADFARDSGNDRIETIFRRAIFDTYHKSYSFTPEKGRAAQSVLFELLPAIETPEGERLYREVLLMMRRIHMRLMKMARSGAIKTMGSIESQKSVLEDLDWELKYEEKRKKTQR